jgi:thiamine kinase-like enzyme
MEDVGSKTVEPEPDADKDSLAHLPPEIREMVRRMKANDPFKVTIIKKPPRASIEDTLTAIYEGKAETFYFQLFSRIKTLAEAKISFADTHVGNILPNPQQVDGLKLIDFDLASIEPSVDIAKATSLSSYTLLHLQRFQSLPDLSPESQSLIKWFQK